MPAAERYKSLTKCRRQRWGHTLWLIRWGINPIDHRVGVLRDEEIRALKGITDIPFGWWRLD
jgi:hypothetical protein